MSLINSLSMRTKLVVLVTPVLLAMLFFAGQRIVANYDDLTEMRELQAMTELVSIADPLLGALQVERGRSVVLLQSDQKLANERESLNIFKGQHQRTDAKLALYQEQLAQMTAANTFDAGVLAAIVESDRALSNLTALRRSIIAKTITPGDSALAYTAMIKQLIDRIPLVIRRTDNAQLTRQVNAYLNMAESAEQAGLERAHGAAIINEGIFKLDSLHTLAALSGKQLGHLEAAIAMLPAESPRRKSLTDFSASALNRGLTDMRDTLFSAPVAGLWQ